MSVESDPASDATVEMPRPLLEEICEDLEEIDPEKTLVRENWESVVIRRVAPHVAAVHSQMAEDSAAESRYGWESEGLRRLAEGMRRVGEF
jgi:diaminopimelate decarboxylase